MGITTRLISVGLLGEQLMDELRGCRRHVLQVEAVAEAARAVFDIAEVVWHSDGTGRATVTVETWNVLAAAFDSLDAPDKEQANE